MPSMIFRFSSGVTCRNVSLQTANRASHMKGFPSYLLYCALLPTPGLPPLLHLIIPDLEESTIGLQRKETSLYVSRKSTKPTQTSTHTFKKKKNSSYPWGSQEDLQRERQRWRKGAKQQFEKWGKETIRNESLWIRIMELLQFQRRLFTATQVVF